jgi:hypothetical protein
VREHFKTPAEIAVNQLYNQGYVARIDEFRLELINRAREREIAALTGNPVDEANVWQEFLLARTREAHDACLITDGVARALLNLEVSDPLPWERDLP